jgi:hypothetical protein
VRLRAILGLTAAVLAAALAVSALAPHAAAAGWSKPVTLTHAADGGPRLAGNARGDSLVVWREAERLAYAHGAPGGAFGPSGLIANGRARPLEFGESDVKVELDEEGGGVLAWRDEEPQSFDAASPCCDVLRAAAFAPGGAFGPTAELHRHTTAWNFDVDVDPLGGASVAWSGDFEVEAATAPRYAGFEPPRTVVNECTGASAVGITAYPGLEDILFACGARGPLRARQLLADGPGPARSVTRRIELEELFVESDRRDAQVVVWTEAEPLGETVRAAVRGTRGPLRGVVRLGRGTEDTAVAAADLSVAPSGHSLVALWRFGSFGGAPNHVLAAVRRPGSRFGPPRALPRSASLVSPAAAVNDGGRAAVAWSDGARVVVARGPGLRTRSVFRFRRPLTAAERDQCEGAGWGCPDVDLAIDRRGAIVVVWRERELIRAARFAPR